MKNLRFQYFALMLLVASAVVSGCQKDTEEDLLAAEDPANLKASGPKGYALHFDGDGDYVIVPDADQLDLADAFTVAAWINIESYVEWASIVTKGGDTDENNYTVHQSGPAGGSDFGNLRFTGDAPDLPTSPYLESTTDIPLNEWHFVAVTWDGETLKFYLNGEEDGSGALAGPLALNDQALHIGADFPGGDEYWHGMIDEVRIWNEALRQSHIRAAMNGHATPLARALVGYWRFDEGTGSVANDQSKYKNHGTLVGDPVWVEL